MEMIAISVAALAWLCALSLIPRRNGGSEWGLIAVTLVTTAGIYAAARAFSEPWLYAAGAAAGGVSLVLGARQWSWSRLFLGLGLLVVVGATGSAVTALEESFKDDARTVLPEFQDRANALSRRLEARDGNDRCSFIMIDSVAMGPEQSASLALDVGADFAIDLSHGFDPALSARRDAAFARIETPVFAINVQRKFSVLKPRPYVELVFCSERFEDEAGIYAQIAEALSPPSEWIPHRGLVCGQTLDIEAARRLEKAQLGLDFVGWPMESESLATSGEGLTVLAMGKGKSGNPAPILVEVDPFSISATRLEAEAHAPRSDLVQALKVLSAQAHFEGRLFWVCALFTSAAAALILLAFSAFWGRSGWGGRVENPKPDSPSPALQGSSSP